MSNTKKLTTLGIMGALSILLVVLIHFPIFPAAAFLEYDPADIPIFISAFMFGPAAGLVLTVAVSIVQGVTVSAGSGIIGILMHIVSTGSFVIVAGNIYKKDKTKKKALIALVLGTLTMITVMVFWNIIFTPIYTGAPRSAILNMLLPIILPFNAIKAGVNSILTMLLYKKVSKFINSINI